MTALIRSQLIGVRTLRSMYAVVLSIVAFVVLITADDLGFNAGSAYNTAAELREPVMVSVGILAAAIFAVYAAARSASDFAHHTITLRLLATPRRSRYLTATLATFGLLAAVIGTAMIALSLAIAIPIVNSHDLSLGLTPAAVVAPVLAVVLMTLIGVAVGILVPNPAGAVTLMLGWFVVEKLLIGFLGDAGAYLPYQTLYSVLDIEGATINRFAGTSALLVITTGICLLAAAKLKRQDIA